MSEGTAPTSTPSPKYLVTYVLGGLLIVASFFIGSLWTKVQTLQQGQGQIAGQQAGQYPAAPGNPDAAAGAQEVITAENVPAVSDEDYIRGSADAKIKLIEYSDFECPFCRQFHPTMEQVMAEYGDQVAWVFRHYPLSFHPQAQPLAEASECVADSAGKEAFWKFADEVFKEVSVNATTVETVVNRLGYNYASVKDCMDSGKFTQKVKDQMSGGAQAGVSGTPGTILITEDGQTELISGALPFEQVKAVIEKYL